MAGTEQLLRVLGVDLVGVDRVGGHRRQFGQPDQVRMGGVEPCGSGGDGSHVGQPREYFVGKETLNRIIKINSSNFN